MFPLLKFKPVRVLVICDGGWKYKGLLVNAQTSFLGRLYWLELSTPSRKRIKIMGDKIVSILYD